MLLKGSFKRSWGSKNGRKEVICLNLFWILLYILNFLMFFFFNCSLSFKCFLHQIFHVLDLHFIFFYLEFIIQKNGVVLKMKIWLNINIIINICYNIDIIFIFIFIKMASYCH